MTTRRTALLWNSLSAAPVRGRIHHRRVRSIVYPGNFGTFNWGAVAVDPDRDMMFSMSVHLAFTVKMIPRADATTRVATRESEPAFNENPGAPYAATRGPSTRH